MGRPRPPRLRGKGRVRDNLNDPPRPSGPRVMDELPFSTGSLTRRRACHPRVAGAINGTPQAGSVPRVGTHSAQLQFHQPLYQGKQDGRPIMGAPHPPSGGQMTAYAQGPPPVRRVSSCLRRGGYAAYAAYARVKRLSRSTTYTPSSTG